MEQRTSTCVGDDVEEMSLLVLPLAAPPAAAASPRVRPTLGLALRGREDGRAP